MNLGDESGSSSARSSIFEYVSSSAAFISCDLLSIMSEDVSQSAGIVFEN
jgi:hypothetical protein